MGRGGQESIDFNIQIERDVRGLKVDEVGRYLGR